MNPQFWEKVINNLDDEITDSAAERFGKAQFSAETTENYSTDNQAMIYTYPQKTKKHRRILTGIVSGAAALLIVFAAGTAIQSRSLQNDITPLSVSLKNIPAATDEEALPPFYAAELTDSFVRLSLEGFSSGLDKDSMLIFEEYFCGIWDNSDEQITISWGEASAFNENYSCTGVMLTDDGCYVCSEKDNGYDLWFVPEEDRDTLYVYRNADISEGEFISDDSGFVCEETYVFSKESESPEYSILGYYGRHKLAADLGMSYYVLYSKTQLETYAGSASGEGYWIRPDEYDPINEPIWDTVLLKSQTEHEIVMTMAFAEKENSIRTEYFEITWIPSDGDEWIISDVCLSSDFASVLTE